MFNNWFGLSRLKDNLESNFIIGEELMNLFIGFLLSHNLALVNFGIEVDPIDISICHRSLARPVLLYVLKFLHR